LKNDWSIPTLELRTKMLVSTTHLKFLEPKGSSSSSYEILSKERESEREREMRKRRRTQEPPTNTRGQMGSKGIKAWFLVPQISDVFIMCKGNP
jgi:hypothetical protein